LRNITTELLSKFSRVGLRELDQKQPDVWAKESYEIAVKIAYENGNLRGTPKGQARDCRDVPDTNFISRGYPGIAKLIADRRVYLAGYRRPNCWNALPANEPSLTPQIKSDTAL